MRDVTRVLQASSRDTSHVRHVSAAIILIERMDSAGNSDASSPVSWGRNPVTRKRKRIEVVTIDSDSSDTETEDNGSTYRPDDITILMQEHGYQISYPKFGCCRPELLAVVSCRGCGLKFNGLTHGYKEPQFFRHCIGECPKYQELDLIRCCSECKLLFLDSNQWFMHKEREHPHPTIAKRRSLPY